MTKVSGVIGNAYELGWNGTALEDKFNQPIIAYDRLYDLRQSVSQLGIIPGTKSEAELIAVLRSNGKAWGDFNDPDRVKPTVVQKNPNHDPALTYVARSKRSEWTCVGLLGCLIVLEDVPGATTPGKYVDCNMHSKAIVGNSYRVMKRISSDTVSIFFRG